MFVDGAERSPNAVIYHRKVSTYHSQHFVHLEKIDVNLPISRVSNLDLILDDIDQAISYVRPGELRVGMVYLLDEDLQPFVNALLSILTTFVCRKTFRKLILHLRTVPDAELYI